MHYTYSISCKVTKLTMTLKNALFWLLLALHSVAQADVVHIATGEYPPWASQYLAHHGITNRIVAEAFKTQGYDVEFHYMPWNRALEATRVGKYAATSFWSYASERAEQFTHSDPVSDIRLMIFHKRTTHIDKWDSLADLAYLRFGATRGYTYNDEFWRLAKQNVLRVSISNSDQENFEKLLKDQIDVFLISQYTGWYMLANNFSELDVARIQTQDKALDSGREYLLFSNNHPHSEALRITFNTGLKKVLASGALERYTRDVFERCCPAVTP